MKTKIKVHKSLPISLHFFLTCATKSKAKAYLSIRENIPLKWRQIDVIFQSVNN